MRLIQFVAATLAVAGTLSVAGGADLVKRDGQHIELITDGIPAAEADTIVATFDAAVEQWSKFWGLVDGEAADFHVQAYLMRDVERFAREGLIPPQVPDFPFGYTLGNQIWVRAQQSEYYTRHLVLHEGVHAFAYAFFKGGGATWFQEGTAELLATHRDSAAQVTVNTVPANRDEVPFWGRFKRMNQSRQQQSVPTLASVLGYQPDLRGDVETYGWSWAAAMMMSRYPQYRPVLLDAARKGQLRNGPFNQVVRRGLADQWPILEARWRVMCQDLDYGFDWSREQVELSIGDPQWNGRPLRVKVAADRGWQSLGVRVPGGVSLRLSATGQVTLADQPKPWLSEPDGITFQYHRGRPLGQLLVSVLPNAINASNDTVQPLPLYAVNENTTLEVDEYSWLLFRVNDAVGQLDDNQGQYEVTVQLANRQP
ncbi:MAG: hypothetical protein P8L85_14220 [Rubripirellula sp.]|nr:hypothetical protein [Rubripirellula sp.]